VKKRATSNQVTWQPRKPANWQASRQAVRQARKQVSQKASKSKVLVKEKLPPKREPLSNYSVVLMKLDDATEAGLPHVLIHLLMREVRQHLTQIVVKLGSSVFDALAVQSDWLAFHPAFISPVKNPLHLVEPDRC